MGIAMDEQRAHRRVALDLKQTIDVQDDKKVPIFDISRGGACFLSVPEYEVGSSITVKTGTLTIIMEVLESRLMEVDRDLGDFRYKVRCKRTGGDVFDGGAFFEILAG